MDSINIMEILLAFAVCIPSAVVGLAFWKIQRTIIKRDEKDAKERAERQRIVDERDQKRRENEFMTFQAVNVSLSLAEVTAEAVQRIPDANCNGEMKEALAYAKEVKHKQRDFLIREGNDSIYKVTEGANR